MEYIIYYLQNSFVFATIGIAILLMPTEKYYKNDKHALYIKIAVSLYLLLSIFTTMEHFAELLPEKNVWRYISTSAGYIIRPSIIFFIGIGIGVTAGYYFTYDECQKLIDKLYDYFKSNIKELSNTLKQAVVYLEYRAELNYN